MSAVPRRRTVLGAGLLCLALTLVVLFTTPAAFRSPTAVVVMALIGTAAVLLQLRLRNDATENQPLRPPLGLNVLGIVFALAALFPSVLHLQPRAVEAMVLGAVCSFALSSAFILHSFRKHSTKPE
jgi:O-antigen/teichoic acid export membrane protein